MSTIGDLTVLRQAIEVMQDGWLSLDPAVSWLVIAGVMLIAAILAIRLFRWE